MNSRIRTVAYVPGGSVNLNLKSAPLGCQRSPSIGPATQRFDVESSGIEGASSTENVLKVTVRGRRVPEVVDRKSVV